MILSSSGCKIHTQEGLLFVFFPHHDKKKKKKKATSHNDYAKVLSFFELDHEEPVTEVREVQCGCPLKLGVSLAWGHRLSRNHRSAGEAGTQRVRVHRTPHVAGCLLPTQPRGDSSVGPRGAARNGKVGDAGRASHKRSLHLGTVILL